MAYYLVYAQYLMILLSPIVGGFLLQVTLNILLRFTERWEEYAWR